MSATPWTKCTRKNHDHTRPWWSSPGPGHCNTDPEPNGWSHFYSDDCHECGQQYDEYIQQGADE